MVTTKYIQTLVEYAESIKEETPEIANTIKKLIREAEDSKSAKIDVQRIQGILAHELRSPLVTLSGYLQLLVLDKIPGIYRIIKNASEQMIDLMELLNLSGSSREELKCESKCLNLEETIRRQAVIFEHLLIEEEIALKIKYDRPDHNPIEVYANSGVINAIFGTLLGNSICWAPRESRITEAIKITTSKNLEFMIENRYSGKKERENHGMGKGRGFPFVNSIIKELNGTLLTYKTRRISKGYDVQEIFGYKEAKGSNGEIFGVKLTIPMSELSFEE